MKTVLVCILLVVLMNATYKNNSPAINRNTFADSLPSDTINFTKQIQPILVNRCSPCHFTGGKMYEKLPFDKAETILSHEEGILRRIKDEKENALIKQFIQQDK